MRFSQELHSTMKQNCFPCRILEARSPGVHSLFVESPSKLFPPQRVIIVTEEMEVHGHQKNSLQFSKSHHPSYQGLGRPCRGEHHLAGQLLSHAPDAQQVLVGSGNQYSSSVKDPQACVGASVTESDTNRANTLLGFAV